MKINLNKYDINHEVITLSNGMRIAHKYLDVPDIIVRTRTNEGMMHEPESKEGILHFIEHLFYRSKKGENLKKKFSKITGRPNGISHSTRIEDILAISRLPNYEFESFLSLWGDMLINNSYDKKIFETEKKIMIHDISVLENEKSPEYYFQKLRKNNFFPKHKWGICSMGNKKSIKSLSLEDVENYNKDRINASNTFLTIVGGYDKRNLKDKLEKYFINLQNKEKRPILFDDLPSLKPINETKIFPNINSSKLYIFFQTPGMLDKDAIFMDILGKYLGGGASSKLFQSIREENGLAYGIGLSTGSGTINTDIGYIVVSQFNKSDYRKIFNLIMSEVKKVKDGSIDKELLNILKQNVLKTFWEDNVEGIKSQAKQIDLEVSKGIPSLSEEIKKWKNVTSEDLTNVARRVFNDKYAIITLYNK